jgi:hypothetical protein
MQLSLQVPPNSFSSFSACPASHWPSSLQSALEDKQSTNIHIVLLTDGEPDNRESVLVNFQTQIEPLEAARCQGRHHGICLSTFGFGFSMNSVRFASFTIKRFAAKLTLLIDNSSNHPAVSWRMIGILSCFFRLCYLR